MRLLAPLLLLSLSAPALADGPMPPMPASWKRVGDHWSWECAVRRCSERPTKWSREGCVERLYQR